MTLEEWEWLTNNPTIGEIKKDFAFKVVDYRHPFHGLKGKLSCFAAFDEQALWLSFSIAKIDQFSGWRQHTERKFSYSQIEIVSKADIDLNRLIKNYKKAMGV